MLPQFAFARDLDHGLGDPNDPGTAFSYRRCADLDQAEAFPTEICARLDELGVPGHYVPAQFGGELRSYELLFMLVRVLSRRDLTVAVAHVKTFLGAVGVWLAGRPEQAKSLSVRVLAGEVVSLALTERDHGADLLAGATAAEPAGAGFRLSGEKWLINNATRAGMLSVLARTDPDGGPRGFTLMMVDKSALHTVVPLPAVATHGIRGADISGVRFDATELPGDAPVGEVGSGLEVVLTGMQVTRILCGALSLGVADHALRVVLDFATTHRLYERPLLDLPQAASTVALAYTDLLIAEAVMLAAARSVHALSAELSVVSAVVKYWVPTTIDATVLALSGVLGARALLTADFADGRFQKLQRDHAVVGIFDGSTHVNLNALVDQFTALARNHARGVVNRPCLRTVSRLAEPLPDLDWDRLSLRSRTGCSMLQSVPDAVAQLRALGVPEALVALGDELVDVVDQLHDRLGRHRAGPHDVSTEAFDLARRYCDCYAAAACLQLWLHNRDTGAADPAGLPWQTTDWLHACLARMLGKLRTGGGSAVDIEVQVDVLLTRLRDQHRAGLLFSLFECRLRGEGRQHDG